MAFIYILRKWSLICRAWFLIAHWQFSVNWSYWALEMRKHYCCMDDELKAIKLLITTFLPEHFQLWHLTLLFFFVLIQLNSVLFSAKSQKPLLQFALRSLSPNHTPHYFLVNLHCCCCPTVTNHSCHSSPPAPTCVRSLLQLSCALSIAFYGWPQVFKLVHLHYFYPLAFTVTPLFL